MKKKELKKRIKDLRELNELLISDNVRLMMRLGGTCTQEDAKGTILERTKEPESKEQNDKRREIYEAQKPIDIDKGFKSGGFVSKNNDKTDYMTQNGKLPNCEYVIDTNTAKRFVDEINNIKLPKTEGPESESELKENTISLEVGKKYMTRDGESFECKELTSTGRYRLENDLCRLFYEENGKLPGGGCGDYDVVSEIKE